MPCLAFTGESNCLQLAKNNLIIRQCKWSRREDTLPTASEVANMDMVEVIVDVLLLLLGTGVVYYLLQQRTQPHARRSEIERYFRRPSEIRRVFACLPYDERAGERGSDKALDGSERLRSNGSHAVGNRGVAAG